MTNYEIKKVSENSYGLYDTDKQPPNDLIVRCPSKSLLEKVKKDFIQSDKAEAKRKKWKKRVKHG